jgi:GntR family transcriptional regulator, colanic acid and biofilm gene transcriptional regulator
MELEQIGYSSLQDIAYERIREALRKGVIRPGDGLKTRDLAKALGVSTTPVREALTRLIAQHVLVVDPVNGIPYVPKITRERLEEIYELREMLEGLAAEHAAENITKEELEKLAGMLAQLKKAKSHDSQDYSRLSEDFQFTVYRAAGRPVLVDLIQSVWLRSGIVLNIMAKPRPKDFNIEGIRETLYLALKAGNAKQAGAAARAAVHTTRDMLLKVLGE